MTIILALVVLCTPRALRRVEYTRDIPLSEMLMDSRALFTSVGMVILVDIFLLLLLLLYWMEALGAFCESLLLPLLAALSIDY